MVYKIVNSVHFIMSVFILIILFLFNTLDYGYKKYISNNNQYTLILSIIFFMFILLVSLFYKTRKKHTEKWRDIKSRYNFVIIFLLSCIHFSFIYLYIFITRWDVNNIITNALILVENGSIWGEYFSWYPNNIFILNLYYLLFSIFKLFGISSNLYYFLIVFLITILCNVTTFMFYKILIKLFTNRVIVYVGMFYYITLVYLSPWISIPYSDSLSLILPICAIYTYLFVKNNIMKLVCISGIFILALNIKPQAAIVCIAIFLLEIIANNDSIKILFKKILITMITCSMLYFVVNMLTFKVEARIDKEKNIGILHFIKMGLNRDNSGGYSARDAEFSQSIADKKERDKANFQVIKERLVEKQLPLHIVKKILVTYNDGTFAWGSEYEFYHKILERKGSLSNFIRSIYYNSEQRYVYFEIFSQANWLMILILTLFSSFRCDEEEKPILAIIQLTLIGLFIFEILFEARARYLFSNVPIFILGAIYGVNTISRIVLIKKGNN